MRDMQHVDQPGATRKFTQIGDGMDSETGDTDKTMKHPGIAHEERPGGASHPVVQGRPRPHPGSTSSGIPQSDGEERANHLKSGQFLGGQEDFDVVTFSQAGNEFLKHFLLSGTEEVFLHVGGHLFEPEFGRRLLFDEFTLENWF
jgi:hypothetical protein